VTTKCSTTSHERTSAFALAGIIVFAPVMAVIVVAILLDDGGPLLFRQERLG
jgi:lipopolysaccharide/colanic/teichoic acid biosynthesis glycosyltransferase